MNLAKYRLVLDVDFDPNGTSKDRLVRNLNQVIRDATNNGTLTGETAATVEHYSFTVTERFDRKPGQHQFADCGGVPRCVTCGCDEDDAYVGGQDCTFGDGSKCAYCGSGISNEDGECQKCGL